MSHTSLLVNTSLLNTVLSALDRDATEGGKPIRGEIAQLIRESIQVPIFETGMDQLGFGHLTSEQERILKERIILTINQFAMELHGGQI